MVKTKEESGVKKAVRGIVKAITGGPKASGFVAQGAAQLKAIESTGSEWDGIPEKEHRAVRAFIAVHSLDSTKVTPQEAYSQIKAGRKEMRERKEEETNRRSAELIESRNEDAIKQAEVAVRALSVVYDMLRQIEEGNSAPALDAQDFAGLAASHLAFHGAALEKALFQLQVYEGSNTYRKKNQPAEGWFAESLWRIVE